MSFLAEVLAATPNGVFPAQHSTLVVIKSFNFELHADEAPRSSLVGICDFENRRS
jgi:hypothetical protein